MAAVSYEIRPMTAADADAHGVHPFVRMERVDQAARRTMS
jgi:hypothetical protein